MVIIQPDYYDNFKCLMGGCPSSCCEMWQIVIDEKSLDYYNNLDTEYGRHIQREIEFCDGEYCFKVHNGRCAFLNEKNLCDIHCNIGSEHMADTCRKFPDFTVENKDSLITGQSMSCPYVAREIVSHSGKVDFLSAGKCTNPYENTLLDIMSQLIKIAYENTSPILEKAKILLSTACKKQGELFEKFEIEEFYIPQDNKTIWDYCDTLNSLTFLTKEWEETVKNLSDLEYTKEDEKEFQKYIDNRQREYEQILVYFIYRYFMTGAGDGNIFLPVKFSVICLRIIYMTGLMEYKNKGSFSVEEQIRLCYTFSKEIEHSEENMDIFLEDISLGMI
ncbi:MAG: flagellin lysine-N-methylase [Ruminococcus sp.]